MIVSLQDCIGSGDQVMHERASSPEVVHTTTDPLVATAESISSYYAT